jgi:hypothetical protein
LNLARVCRRSIQSAGARYTPACDPSAPNVEIRHLVLALDLLSRGDGWRRWATQQQSAVNSAWSKARSGLKKCELLERCAPDSLVALLARLTRSRPFRRSGALARIHNAAEMLQAPLTPVPKALWEEASGLRETKPEERTQEARERIESIEDDLRSIQEYLNALGNLATVLTRNRPLIEGNAALLLGSWGTGKTHFLCDITKARLDRGLPTLLVLARDFDNAPDMLSSLCRHTNLFGNIERLLDHLNAQSRKRRCLAWWLERAVKLQSRITEVRILPARLSLPTVRMAQLVVRHGKM